MPDCYFEKSGKNIQTNRKKIRFPIAACAYNNQGSCPWEFTVQLYMNWGHSDKYLRQILN